MIKVLFVCHGRIICNAKTPLQNKGFLAVGVEFTKDLPEMRLGYH